MKKIYLLLPFIILTGFQLYSQDQNGHTPQINKLKPDEFNKLWSEIDNMPHEPHRDDPVTSWSCIGPFGMKVDGAPSTKYTGMITDIDVSNGVSTRISSSYGGLWGAAFIFPIPLSDALNTLAIGSFSCKPGDANTIIVGTGQAGNSSGTGFYKTTDCGTTWTACIMNPVPQSAYKVRFNPSYPDVVHAATTSGYFRSNDAGTSFTLKLQGDVSDVYIYPPVPSILFAAVINDGIYKSVDNGETWFKLTGGGIPVSNIGRTSIGGCSGNYRGFSLFIGVSKYSDNTMMGIYMSSDAGASWINRSPLTDIYNGTGWFSNCIGGGYGVILAGGKKLWRSTNAGISWTQINDINVHDWQFSITLDNNQQVWVGNRGGMSFSIDAGVTWWTDGNIWPISSFYRMDAGKFNTNVIFGGTERDGIAGTTDGGLNWNVYLSSNLTFTSGTAVDPANNSSRIWTYTWGNGCYRSTNYGQTWTSVNNGIIQGDGVTVRDIRDDKVAPVYLYTGQCYNVYASYNGGDSWSQLTTFTRRINYLNVSVYSYPSAVIYASLEHNTGNDRLKVYDSGTWYNRALGFPENYYVKKIAQHETNNNIAYALLSPAKIFKTTNRGQSWTDISGNIPAGLYLSDLIPHPTDDNKLYAGTFTGCFRTTDGGNNWMTWNNGMPKANIIEEMNYIDSTSSNGKFYVLACSFGRSMWEREISGSDPLNRTNMQSTVIVKNFALGQNYPNPFNPVTKIKYQMPVAGNVNIKIYNILGKEIANLINEKQEAGFYEVRWDAANYPSGVYFYKMVSGDFTETKKMLLIK